MNKVKAKFRLVSTERAAIFAKSSKRDFDQTGWGTTVKLQQIRSDAMTVPMMLVLNAQEAKMFEDAPIGAEFEVTISPLQG